MGKLWVVILESGSSYKALQEEINTYLAEPGQEFEGIEFHVVGSELVAILMFRDTGEEGA